MRNPFIKKDAKLEDPKKRKKLIIATCLLVVFLIGLGTLTDESEADHEGEAKIPDSASQLTGIDYEDAIRKFKNSGFTNIQTKPLDDLITGWLTKDGEVERVSIGGDTDYSAGTWVRADIEVVITYHTFPEDEDREEVNEEELDAKDTSSETAIQEQLSSYIGKSTTELLPVLESLNYKASYTAENTGMDFTEQFEYDKTYAELFVVTGFRNINDSERTVEVLMLGLDTIADERERNSTQEALSAKLDSSYAWQAVERYGEAQYPAGFKLHWWAGKLAEEADDENTWFLKAYCDVTGKGEDLECEAKVTGTTENPRVIYFMVY